MGGDLENGKYDSLYWILKELMKINKLTLKNESQKYIEIMDIVTSLFISFLTK